MSAAPKITHGHAPTDRVIEALTSAGCEPSPCGPRQWESRCPAHGGTSRKNLAVKEADDGRVLIHCHHEPACGFDAIVASIGLKARDLFPPKAGAAPKKDKQDKRPWPSLDGARKWLAAKLKATLGPTWEYRDAKGELIGVIVRYNTPHDPKNPKTYRPFRVAPGGWEMADPKAGFPLYRLDKLPTSGPLWYFEGEKCADLAASLGLPATTTAHGAKSPHKTEHAPAAGRPVFIVPDNNDAGEKYADALGNLLGALSAPVVPRIVRLPDLADPKDDIAEWIGLRRSQGKSDADILAELDALAAVAPEWTPPAVSGPSIPWLDVARPDDPFTMAMLHLEGFRHQGTPTLRYYQDEFVRWDGSAWRPVKDGEIGARMGLTVHDALMQHNAAEAKESNWKKADRKTIGDAVGALKSLTILDGDTQSPAWLTDSQPFPASEVLPTRNALVHLPSFVQGAPSIVPPTPEFFCRYCVDYDFDENPPEPVEWFRFLRTLWEADQESIDCLQEIFGYHLTEDVSQEKIFAHIGPKRSGKGTVARTLRHMIGLSNVAGPTLSGLATNFGLAPLIGKLAAIVDDARLSGRVDQGVITERLLSISGRGELTIDRKHREAWTGTLSTRISILSNELPRLNDTSGALPSRFIILKYTKSFYGKEDKGLSARLLAELPGILRWSIEGWKRLNHRGHFIQPASGQSLVDMANDLSSPVGQFVRDRCEMGPQHECVTGELFAEWESWCDANKRDRSGTPQQFAKNLHAATGIEATNPTTRKGHLKPVRLYLGIKPL